MEAVLLCVYVFTRDHPLVDTDWKPPKILLSCHGGRDDLLIRCLTRTLSKTY